MRAPTLAESRLARFVILGALYFAQGVPWGFISVGYVVFLTDQGLDNTAIGSALGLAYVPWSFKILGGPLLDRYLPGRHGRRRPFILGAQLMMGITLLALLAVDPKDLGLLGAVLFAHNAFAALQDVATDALAVDVLPSDERGSANSVMWAAKSAGVAVGGGAGTVIAKHFGWSTLFVLNAVAIWIVMAMVLLVRERPEGASAATAPRRLGWAELKRSFGFAAPLWGLAVALVVPLGYALVGAVVTRLLRADLGFSEERIAVLSGTLDPLASVLGALLGGVLADRLGVRRAMGGAVVMIALTLGGFGLARGAWSSHAFVMAILTAQAFFIAALNASSLGFFMTLSNPAIGATQFAAFMAATNLTYSFASPLGGAIADRLGPGACLTIAGAVQLASVLLLFAVDPRDAERRFRLEAEPA